METALILFVLILATFGVTHWLQFISRLIRSTISSIGGTGCNPFR